MNVVMFCSLAAPDVSLYNALHRYLEARGARLFLIIFEKYTADLQWLSVSPGCRLYLGSSSLERMRLPSAPFQSDPVDRQWLQELFALECEIYRSPGLSAARFYRKAQAFYTFVARVLSVLSPAAAIRFHSSVPAHTAVRQELRRRGIRFLDFERWAFPKTYVFSEHGYGSSDWRRSPVDPVLLARYQEIARQIFTSADQIYSVSREEPYVHPDPYLLFLTSDGITTGTALRHAEEYASIGSGWGDDRECLGKLESILARVWPDCALLVRQHPYTRPRLSDADGSRARTRVVNDKSLEDLIGHAIAVVCGHTGLVYHALRRSKMVAVLGHYELEGTGVLTSCQNVVDLERWVIQVKADGGAHRSSRPAVEAAVAAYLMTSVVALDHPDTFRILDPYVPHGTPGALPDVPQGWHRLRRAVRALGPVCWLDGQISRARRVVSRIRSRRIAPRGP